MVKAIETQYKGYRFRSRLEARWAVAFDTIGHAYLYEHEGFELPSGKYLPDFYFPNLDIWGEVKPTAFTQKELRKCADLVLYTHRPCVLLIGVPEPTNYYFLFEYEGDVFDVPLKNEVFPGVGFEDCDLWWRSERFYVCTGWGCEFMEKKFIETNEKPALAARAARFEFGESG